MSRRRRGRRWGAPRGSGLPHVVLAGDSIFDNISFTHGGPDVASHLKALVGDRWDVTLVALNGATTQTLGKQVAHIPLSASRIFVSIGGNDALQHSGILVDRELKTTYEVLDDLAWMRVQFEADYGDAVDQITAFGVPVTICTIYDCDWPYPDKAPIGAALCLFNDVIIRYANTHGLPLLDLRQVCTEPSDYVNQIEPSDTGGGKIAAAIARMLPGRE